MKKLLCGLMALVCVTLAGPAFAATQNCATKDAAGNCIPGQVLIDPTTGLPYAASGGSGGGGAVTVTDGADVTQGAKADAMYTGTGAATVTAILKGIWDRENQILTGLSDTSASHVIVDSGSITLPTGASTAANQATLNATIGTIGSTAPTTGINMLGTGPSGNSRSVQTSTSGGLLPGQASPTSTRTALAASTATQIDIARSGRLLATVQMDGSPNAAVYICFTQTTTCSATVYDIKVASGAADATIYTSPFGSTGAIYAYTTSSTVTVNTSSWTAL